MKMLLRIAVVASLGVAAFLTSSYLVARGTNAPAQAEGHGRGVENLRVMTPAEAAVARGLPVLDRLSIRDLDVLFDGQKLAIRGVGELDNHFAPRRLAWSVRILDPGVPGEVDMEDREVYYERLYNHQAFDLAKGASARPTFADVLTLPAPLPPGRYAVELALVDPAGLVRTSAGRWVKIK